MTLFQTGGFTLYSGRKSDWKINSDALTDADLACLAGWVAKRLQFSQAIPVPTSGNRFATALEKHINEKSKWRLIVDDVLINGQSMQEMRDAQSQDQPFHGIVIFATVEPPPWVHAIWTLW